MGFRANVIGLPAGGNAGDALEKNSGTSYDVLWTPPTAKANDWGRASLAAAPGGAFDDEFTAAAIDPAYTRVCRAGTLGIWTQRYKRLVHRWRENGTVGDLDALVKPHAFVAGDYLETAIWKNTINQSNNGVGLIFADGNVFGAGNQLAVWIHSNRVMLIHGTNFSGAWNNDGQTAPRWTGDGSSYAQSAGLFFLRLQYLGAGSWAAFFSSDGFEWQQLGNNLVGINWVPTYGGVVYVNWDAVGPMAIQGELRYLRLNPANEAA